MRSLLELSNRYSCRWNMGALTKIELYNDEYFELQVLRGAIYSIEQHLRENENINRNMLLSILDFTKEEVSRVKAPREEIYRVMERIC